MSPYVSEHSCRLLSPEAVIQCRRTERISDGKKYGIITCEFEAPVAGAGKSKWAEQSYRYPIDEWTESEARKHCSKHKGTFEPAKKPIEKSDLPPGEFVAKRQIIRSQNGSSIFVKLEGNPDSDYPIAQGKEIEKRALEDFEYLLHHAHIEGEEIEETHHCLLSDHNFNLFEIDHIEVNGETYHIIKGLEPTQDIVWADEEARQKGIEPKELRAGMSFEQKADEW